ncbi:MAG: hypothetical protein ACOC7P_00230 [Chloroflexota bacterium]
MIKMGIWKAVSIVALVLFMFVTGGLGYLWQDASGELATTKDAFEGVTAQLASTEKKLESTRTKVQTLKEELSYTKAELDRAQEKLQTNSTRGKGPATGTISGRVLRPDGSDAMPWDCVATAAPVNLEDSAPASLGHIGWDSRFEITGLKPDLYIVALHGMIEKRENPATVEVTAGKTVPVTLVGSLSSYIKKDVWYGR